MAETTQFVSRISVKDLISAFESKSETVRVEFSRPRARSFGNVLNKNVVVRLHEFITLEDVEKGLTKLETNLNFYEVYNKAKHVAFQEQFFNILTSIANIENDDADAPTRKKRLISRTQTLVSFLNQKLPSNINQVVEEKPKNQYSYTPYSSYIKSNSKPESNATNSEESKQSNGSDEQPTLYVESNSTVDVTDSGEAYIVSVKKLKENFLPKDEKQTETILKQENTSKITQKSSGNSSSYSVSSTLSTQSSQQPKQRVKQTDKQPLKEEKDTPKEEKGKAVSVTKLRSLFEQRSEENSKGLEIITVDKSQLTKHILGGSIQNISIPFTERNLGTFRLQRSVSGNYMNYSGLLKRIDINRSNSAFDVNKENSPIVSESDDESSDVEVENTLGKKSVVIEEIRENNTPAILENQENRRSSEGEVNSRPVSESVKVEENIAKFEAIATQAKIFSVKENHSEREYVAAIKKINEIKIKHSSKSEQEENNNNEKHNLSNGRTTFSAESENEKFSFGSENSETSSHEQSFKEEETYYSSASLESNKASEEELTFKGDEIEVNSGIPVSENIAKFEAIATESKSKIESNRASEEVLTFKGEETEINLGIPVSETVTVEENIAKFEAVATEAKSKVESSKASEDESTFKGEETEVNSEIPVSETVTVEENIAKFEAVATEAKSKIESSKASEDESTFKGEETEVNSEIPVSETVTVEENIAKFEAVATEDKSKVGGNRASEEELTFTGEETEVNSGIPVSESVTVEENIAKFEAVAIQAKPISGATENDSDTTSEDESSVKDGDEIKVNSGHVKRQSGEAEETDVTLEATAEAEQSVSIPETKEHVTDSMRDDETSHSAFSSLLELEDERDRSLIEEEMKKIDVEQTLANADLVLDSEDLKNADDEFEKLIENSESGKIIG